MLAGGSEWCGSFPYRSAPDASSTIATLAASTEGAAWRPVRTGAGGPAVGVGGAGIGDGGIGNGDGVPLGAETIGAATIAVETTEVALGGALLEPLELTTIVASVGLATTEASAPGTSSNGTV